MTSFGRIAWLACLLFVSACPGNSIPPADVAIDIPRDAMGPDIITETGGVNDAVSPAFDAGPAPACTAMAAARHIVDRPGGDRAQDPSSFVSVTGGYLVGLRRIDSAAPDAGLNDAGRLPIVRDSADLLALDADGMPRGTTVSLYDGVPMGTTPDGPLLFSGGSSAFAVFQEVRGTASAPDFMLRLQSTTVDAMGMGPLPTLLRDHYPRPSMAQLGDRNLVGVTVRFDIDPDGGIPTATPTAMYLSPSGMNLRPLDVNINSYVPMDVNEPVMRGADDGGSYYVYRSNGHVGFLRFAPNGVIDPRGAVEVNAPAIGTLDDAASVSDGVIAASSRQSGTTTEVRVIVSGPRGALRLDRVLETYMGEGPTVATVVPAYGGVAVLWRRGVDAAARVRFAIVAPDGVVRAGPMDLLPAPGIEGRVLAVVDGRTVAFVVRDGMAPRWGYSFGRACLPQ